MYVVYFAEIQETFYDLCEMKIKTTVYTQETVITVEDGMLTLFLFCFFWPQSVFELSYRHEELKTKGTSAIKDHV